MLTIVGRNAICSIRRSDVCLGLRSRNLCSSNQSYGQQQHPQLSPYDVNLILRENEYTHNFLDENSSIHSYETNQLGSNKPCEDSRTEASFIHKNGFICGIFDGHAGAACAQVVSKRLLRYLAATLISRDVLRNKLNEGCTSQSFLKCHNDNVDFVREVKSIYEKSFTKFAEAIASQKLKDRAADIEKVFLHLDNDISEEAIKHADLRTMSVAMSGAVTCVAHIENLDLHVASTGDCSAVLGSQCPETGAWIPKKLNIEHNTDNTNEVNRILNEHPKEEHETAIKNDRLLGQLAPLRAFGDFRYKWSNEMLSKYIIPVLGENAIPPHYYTPPYLTAQPEVQHHVLRPNDKFLVIASDGLWDFLAPSQVVSLVGEHILSKRKLEAVKLPSDDVTLQEVADILAKRKAGLSRKPIDQNSATHLIRNALGGTDFGIEHSKISYYLTLPQDVVRYYRDDITITVIYFNSDYIDKQTSSPANANE